MALTFTVNDRDLSPYLRLAHDQGFDPADADYAEPQFSGAPAFRDGQAFVADALGNREWEVPLFLKASTIDGLHQLIRDINSDLAAGGEVVLGAEGTSASTHFILERGRLEPDYEHWIVRVARIRATLRLWTRPRGTTGTARTVASLGATAAVEFAATGILGDTDALANLEVRVGSKVASSGRVVGFGVHSSASFAAIRGPSAADFVAQSGATVRGYSGALGSQALAIPVSPTGASGVALTSFLAPPGGHVGRHRVFCLARSRLDAPITLYARDRFGARLGPTTAASQTDPAKWGLVDLGEVQVPGRDSRQEAVPTQYVELVGGGASGHSINASPALEVNRLVYLPLEKCPGLLRTPGGGGQLLYYDSFDRLDGTSFSLGAQPTPDVGDGVWRRIRGALGSAEQSGAIQWAQAVAPQQTGEIGEAVANASGFYSLASGALHQDVRAMVRTGLSFAASPAVASSAIELWVKQLNASQGMYARLDFTPSHALRIYAATGAATVCLASAVGASVAAAASGFYAGKQLLLAARVDGNTFSAHVGTSAVGAASVSVSNGFFTFAGWPALKMNAGSNVASAVITADDFTYDSPGAAASDIGAREWFRFQSWPERRAIQGNASVFIADRAAEFRGDHPCLPPVGSPGASGPARVVVMAGDPDDFLGNDLLDVRVDAVEQFAYLR